LIKRLVLRSSQRTDLLRRRRLGGHSSRAETVRGSD
jgi:hypothetical protein